MFGLMMRTPDRYIEKAPIDMPEIGIMKGQFVVNLANMQRDAAELARTRGPQLQVEKAKTEKTDRAKQINKAVETAPKAPSRTQQSAPGAKKAVPVRGAAEWQRRLLRMAREV